MHVSPTEAVKTYNVSKPTLYEDMKNGRISYQKNERNKRRINVAELDRVYDKRVGGLEEANVKVRNYKTELNDSNPSDAAKVEITYLKELNKQQKEQFEAQIQSLQGALDKAQEGQNRLTLLLEDQRSKESGAGEWEKALKALEHRIANQEANEKNLKERAQKEINKHKNALEEEKKKLKAEQNKTVWQKLFG
ncbi:MAG: hypothetical protein GY941_12370 [Planctomycetes bacterium]|nr:hypothetical protein [Planctomycetota bacterium]